jgi:hypothetical protein
MNKFLQSFSDEHNVDYQWDSNEKTPKSIIITIDATHAGYRNKNGFFYDPKAMKYAVERDAWTKPFAKPLLKNHDMEGEPMGRVVAARFIDTNDGKGYTQLDVKVTDTEAVEKIIDGRYLTVSTHGSPMADADQAYNFTICSVCDANLNTDEFCGHMRGRVYEDEDDNSQLCFWKIGAMEYKEVSVVNTPADNDGKTAAQITGVQLAMLDGEDPVVDTDQKNLSHSSMIFADNEVSYVKDISFNETQVANTVLWESVKKDKEAYIEQKGLIFKNTEEKELEEEVEDATKLNPGKKKDRKLKPAPPEEKKKDKKEDVLDNITSEINGHRHNCMVDDKGNGKANTSADHSHEIEEFEIQEFCEDGMEPGSNHNCHTHTLIKPGDSENEIVFNDYEVKKLLTAIKNCR